LIVTISSTTNPKPVVLQQFDKIAADELPAPHTSAHFVIGSPRYRPVTTAIANKPAASPQLDQQVRSFPVLQLPFVGRQLFTLEVTCRFVARSTPRLLVALYH
jgi:hypothetical protein